jgi:AraC-like DNA-binding protein
LVVSNTKSFPACKKNQYFHLLSFNGWAYGSSSIIDMANGPGLRQKIIHQVHHFIENNLDRPLSIKELSDVNCLSYSGFRHLYEEATKEPVWHYVKRYRIEYAAGLLRHSDFSCATISEVVGYASKHAFSKAFSNQVGISPTGFKALSLLPTDKTIARQVDETVFHELKDFQKLCDEGSLRTERIVNRTYFYRREHALTEAAVMQLAGSFFRQFPGRDLVISTPDIVCVSGLGGIRMNYGFIDDNHTLHGDFLSREIKDQRYLVYTYKGPMHLIGVYVYKLIDIGKKTQQLSIRNHHSLVVINHQNPSPEIWIAV